MPIIWMIHVPCGHWISVDPGLRVAGFAKREGGLMSPSLLFADVTGLPQQDTLAEADRINHLSGFSQFFYNGP